MKRKTSSNVPRLPLVALFCAAAATLAAATGTLHAQERGADATRKSKNGLVEGKIGGAEVKITYGRPEVRGRAIWGSVVPYGEVWRAGADEATTITFSKDVTVAGKPVPAGTYALFLVPKAGAWTFVLNKTAKQWGAFRYAADQDLLRVDATPAAAEHAEQLTFKIDGNRVVLHWEKTAGGFEVAG